jgi:hypothetical protein
MGDRKSTPHTGTTAEEEVRVEVASMEKTAVDPGI